MGQRRTVNRHRHLEERELDRLEGHRVWREDSIT
jgi:hypothetical protein